MTLRTIEIYAQPTEGFGMGQPWLVHNVAYIYAKLLSHKKLECGGIKRLNIYLRSKSSLREMGSQGGIANIDVEFAPDGIVVSDALSTQTRLAEAVAVALKRLCGGFESVIDEVHGEVLATGFSTEDIITKAWRRSPSKKYAARVGMATGFDRTSIFLEFRSEREPVRRFQLFTTRPAPFIAYMAVKEVDVDDSGDVEVVLRHPGDKYLTERLFGFEYYDIGVATVAPVVEDRKDAIVLRFPCAGQAA